MAKISYSALVSRIRGKLAGTVFSQTKGITYLKRHNPRPSDRKTTRQADIRGTISDLAGEWYSLSATLKSLWEAYASMLPRSMSGIDAYISLNQRLIHYLGTTAKRTGPPPTPGTPQHVQGASTINKGASDFCIAWTSPSNANTYIIVGVRPVLGIERTTSQQWKYGAVAASNLLSARVNTEYPTDYTLKFRIRTLDTYGRLSPWSHIHTGSEIMPGRYGTTAYSYSYYGP